MKRYILLCISVICASFAGNERDYSSKKAIFVDLGGILFDRNKFKIFTQEIGIFTMLRHGWHRKSLLGISTEIQDKLFEILDTCEPWPTTHNFTPPYDEHGRQLPYIMFCWLTGKASCQSIKKRVLRYIIENPCLFNGSAQQKIVYSIASMMFTPKKFIQCQQVNRRTIALLQLWKQMGYELYVLSNWDAQSFELLKQEYPAVFNLFDGEVVSGIVGLAKPDRAIYTHALEKYNLTADQAYFIDDQLPNIVAAQTLGITGLYCPTEKHILELLQCS